MQQEKRWYLYISKYAFSYYTLEKKIFWQAFLEYAVGLYCKDPLGISPIKVKRSFPLTILPPNLEIRNREKQLESFGHLELPNKMTDLMIMCFGLYHRSAWLMTKSVTKKFSQATQITFKVTSKLFSIFSRVLHLSNEYFKKITVKIDML